MVINRPDPDEETYIGLMVSYLSNPFSPINTLPDFQFGAPTARYAISSLDPLRAVISYITGYRLLSIYYIWVPAVGAGIAAIISLRFFRLFKNDQWIVAMIFLTAIMLIWGDVHELMLISAWRASFKVKVFS